MNNRIEVQTSARSYSVETGRDILEQGLQTHLGRISTDTLFVLIDENVSRHHRDRIGPVLDKCAGQIHTMEVPSGESSKSAEFWSRTMDFLLKNQVRRNTPLLVIGGGVTGDLGGFAAATVLRGIPYIHIPTTVLAMVDSSIGGKTGINHPAGKNLIGSFYQPSAVIADIRFLETLPRREWINGLSEILKYGAISDETIFSESEIFFDRHPEQSSAADLAALIAKCVRIKAEIVARDEFEGGVRAFLNFGHTFAHALEKACGFQKISHGEAVYLGMLAARKLSRLTGSRINGNKIEAFRSLYQFRVKKDDLFPDDLIRFMKSDKKRTGEHLRFVLLESWQHPVVKTVKKKELISDALQVILDEL